MHKTLLFMLVLLLSTLTVGAADQSVAAVKKLLETGAQLDAKQAGELEERLLKQPTDMDARVQLLGYLAKPMQMTDQDLQAHACHVLWIVENDPRHPVLDTYQGRLFSSSPKAEQLQVKQLFQKHLEISPNDAVLIRRLVGFLSFDDKSIEPLLKQGAALDPKNPHWYRELSKHHAFKSIYADDKTGMELRAVALEEEEKALSLSTEEFERFDSLQRLPFRAYAAGKMEKAQTYANQVLEASGNFKDSKWLYSLTVHRAHIVLGLVAVGRDQLKLAGEELIKSTEIDVPDPKLPWVDLRLADALLDRGERQVVLEYLKACEGPWESGRESLQLWSATIRHGRRPDFKKRVPAKTSDLPTQ
jgi:hypothetical protein